MNLAYLGLGDDEVVLFEQAITETARDGETSGAHASVDTIGAHELAKERRLLHHAAVRLDASALVGSVGLVVVAECLGDARARDDAARVAGVGHYEARRVQLDNGKDDGRAIVEARLGELVEELAVGLEQGRAHGGRHVVGELGLLDEVEVHLLLAPRRGRVAAVAVVDAKEAARGSVRVAGAEAHDGRRAVLHVRPSTLQLTDAEAQAGRIDSSGTGRVV